MHVNSPVHRRGAAAVEFALTAPILFALVLGAIEFSRANMLVHTASIAATEAARRSIIPGATAEEVRLKALDELATIGVVDATVNVDPPEIFDDTTQVQVDLTIPVTLRNGYGVSRVFLGKQVFKSVTLQREGKVEDVSSEKVKRAGIEQDKNLGKGSDKDKSNNGNSGNSNAGSGNSGNGNSGNSGSGSSNTGSGNAGSGSLGSGGSGNSSSGSSGSGSSGSGSGSSGSSGSGGGGGGGGSGKSGFWDKLRGMLGL
jgi:hypothetical protein